MLCRLQQLRRVVAGSSRRVTRHHLASSQRAQRSGLLERDNPMALLILW
jgi:hypothetical protein